MILSLDLLQEKQSDYAQTLADAKMSKNTICKHLSAINKFMDYAAKSAVASNEIVKGILDSYKECLVQTHKPTTVNLYIVALNCYLKYLGYDDLCIRTTQLPPARNSLENGLSLTEYRELLRVAKNMDNAAYYVMRTLASTGIRLSELEYITVDAVRCGAIDIPHRGKTRQVILSAELRDELLCYCSMNSITLGLVFRGRNARSLAESTISRWLKNVAEEAGIDAGKAVLHNLRHLFATVFMEHNNDLIELARVLGLSNLNSTKIYRVRTDESEIRKRLNALGL